MIESKFLDECKSKRVLVTVYVTNGFQIKGEIVGYSPSVIVIKEAGRQKMIYKSAISTIIPGVELKTI